MKNTFETLLKERFHNDEKIEKILKNIQNRLERRLPEGVAPSLTKFQEKVIASPKFWRNWNEDAETEHLMIQGATSAGKTLLSELNILDALHHDQKAIVLVPLKAMVRERTMQFREDMTSGMEEYEIKVYGSSSDYMENDERLIRGDYTVANIVYEKFFAMVSQGQRKLLERCGLLIVDELSMLGVDQRGPKLEMALEIVRKKFPHIRIMCLATCDCSTEKICKWLDIEKPIISTARPVALEEHIMDLKGNGIYRLIPANHECEMEEDAPEKIEEKIEIPGYNADWSFTKKKQELLLTVIEKMYAENPDARVLVFSPSKKGTELLADFLNKNRGRWYPAADGEAEYDEDFMSVLNTCDRDEGQDKLVDELIPSGIAYHHAGISTTLRELIEEQFSKPHSNLRVIVATETLTIGVNMPFDAMIITDHRVPAGVGDPIPLSQQGYRNYIGRAGRLGQSNRLGKTYLFIENPGDRDFYWNSYYNRSEIKSAMTAGDEEMLAPYYLSMLNNNISGAVESHFSLSQLETLFQQSLAKICGKKSFDATLLCEKLHGAKMADKVVDFFEDEDDSDFAEETSYAIKIFGKHMAPYAFSIATCKRIYKYFYIGYRRKAMPLNLSQEDIKSDRYLLDILYHICRHDEIARGSSLNFPTIANNAGDVYTARVKVLAALLKILEETDEAGNKKNILWSDLYETEETKGEERWYSDIWMLLNSSNVSDEPVCMQAAMRAVILLYWTKGYTTKKIRELTGFNDFLKNFVTGDIERLAEVASFHLDAVQKCLSSAVDPKTHLPVYKDSCALKEFYALQTRVKYGMPRDLVVFANKHIHGLDRRRLLDLKEKAKEAGLTPMQYLYITPPGKIPTSVLTPSQIIQLKQSLERRSAVESIDTLTEIIANDLNNDLTETDMKWTKEMFAWKGVDEDKMPSVSAIYDGIKAARFNTVLSSVEIYTDGLANRVIWKTGDSKIFFGILCNTKKNSDVERFFSEENTAMEKPLSKILIVPDHFSDEEKIEAMKTYNANAVFDNVFLAYMLAKTVGNTLFNGQILTDMFADLCGIFTKADYNFFPLAHYLRKETVAAPKFRVIYGNSFCRRDENSLNADTIGAAFDNTKDLTDYEVLPWGHRLTSGEYDLTECPTIVLLNRSDVTCSRSLTNLIYIMRNQDSRNCLLLLKTEDEAKTWDSNEPLEEYGRNVWSDQFNKIRKAVAPDTQTILTKTRELLAGWEHTGYLIGISYSHYNPQASEETSDSKNDNDLLFDLAEKLRAEYGEDRILYDEYLPAKKLFFDNRGKEKSLLAYGECKYYIVLWNLWTKENRNCQDEREVILKRCEDDSAKCIFLQPAHNDVPDTPDSYYAMKFTELTVDDVFEEIKDQIRSLGL